MECKCVYIVSKKAGISGFISTIWNVNTHRIDQVGVLKDMFYLNYMECKCSISSVKLNQPSKFYLNYMECKSLTPNALFCDALVFYLNYMECKFFY